LHGFLGVLGDFAVGGKRFLHDAADVGDGEEAVLLAEIGAGTVLAALVATSAAWTRGSIGHGRRNPNRRRWKNMVKLEKGKTLERDNRRERRK